MTPGPRRTAARSKTLRLPNASRLKFWSTICRFAASFRSARPCPAAWLPRREGPFGVYIGCRTESPFGVTLRLIPRKLRVGLGCRRGTEQAAIETAVRQVFRENRLALAAISGVSSIDLKQDELGLLAACRANGWQAPVLFRGAAARRTGQLYGLELRRLRHGRG